MGVGALSSVLHNYNDRCILFKQQLAKEPPAFKAQVLSALNTLDDSDVANTELVYAKPPHGSLKYNSDHSDMHNCSQNCMTALTQGCLGLPFHKGVTRESDQKLEAGRPGNEARKSKADSVVCMYLSKYTRN